MPGLRILKKCLIMRERDFPTKGQA
jgi:hypothetical protein